MDKNTANEIRLMAFELIIESGQLAALIFTMSNDYFSRTGEVPHENGFTLLSLAERIARLNAEKISEFEEKLNAALLD